MVEILFDVDFFVRFVVLASNFELSHVVDELIFLG